MGTKGDGRTALSGVGSQGAGEGVEEKGEGGEGLGGGEKEEKEENKEEEEEEEEGREEEGGGGGEDCGGGGGGGAVSGGGVVVAAAAAVAAAVDPDTDETDKEVKVRFDWILCSAVFMWFALRNRVTPSPKKNCCSAIYI